LTVAGQILSDEFYERLAEFCKGQANPKRLKIISLLSSGEKSVSEISQTLNIPQANLSQHLNYMKRAGVLRSRREGLVVYYCLADMRIAQACNLLKQLIAEKLGIETP
jgi:DNA-binding transcriptional ArsR family regulator